MMCLQKLEIPETNKQVLSEFLKTFDINDDKDTWWNKIKDIAAQLGIENGDAAMALRVALTGRTNTPDLYSIMRVMGVKKMVIERIKKVNNAGGKKGGKNRTDKNV